MRRITKSTYGVYTLRKVCVARAFKTVFINIKIEPCGKFQLSVLDYIKSVNILHGLNIGHRIKKFRNVILLLDRN